MTPLEGLTVLDLTRLLPGPAATRMLADWGATVVKIEPPEGDYAARLGLPAEAPPETIAPLYTLVNRGKRIERLDLKTEAGRSRLLDLARSADALLEGFRPGVMARLGLGYDVLARENPRLVVAAITGYGQTGPWAQRAGHDLNYLAISGILDQIGERGRPPAIPNWQIADLAGGALAAAAKVCAALVGAQRTGRGTFLDIAMAREVAALNVIAEHGAALGRRRPRGEDWLTGGWPCYGVYPTADERHLAVGALEPKFWETLCAALGKPHLRPLGWAEGIAALAVRKELADTFRTRTLAEWSAFFEPIDCCVTPVLTLEEARAHPLFAAGGETRGRD